MLQTLNMLGAGFLASSFPQLLVSFLVLLSDFLFCCPICPPPQGNSYVLTFLVNTILTIKQVKSLLPICERLDLGAILISYYNAKIRNCIEHTVVMTIVRVDLVEEIKFPWHYVVYGVLGLLALILLVTVPLVMHKYCDKTSHNDENVTNRYISMYLFYIN